MLNLINLYLITDVSTRNKMAIIISTWDGDLNVEFLDLVRCKDATAEGLTMAVLKALEDANTDYSKMVAFSSDTCNTIFGERNSVSQKLKLKIPHLLSVKCVCHLIHLCSSKAFAQLPKQARKTTYL